MSEGKLPSKEIFAELKRILAAHGIKDLQPVLVKKRPVTGMQLEALNNCPAGTSPGYFYYLQPDGTVIKVPGCVPN